MIDRVRLYRLLDHWQGLRAIAIHAPTGYGKSSLVSRWIDVSGLNSCCAWLSLEESDSDPHQFAQHLAAALDRVIPGCMARVQPILQDRQGDMQRVLQSLFVSIQDRKASESPPCDQQILLVLDDLNRVQSEILDDTIMAILEQGPSNLHLILLARWRTALPIARLCSQGQILPLDSQDLRFTEQEIGEYLAKHGFDQTPDVEIKQLQERTEGWVVALQLAVISLRDRSRISALIQNLHGDRSWLADYLVDEVINQQTPDLQRFMLQTSILEKFNAELSAAVSKDEAAYARMEDIIRQNLFLIPLDEEGCWFRYHHLFRELLQNRLQASLNADSVAELHRQAGNWLARENQAEAAVRHYLAGGVDDRAVALVEDQLRGELLKDYYRAKALLATLPDEILAQSPQLMLDRCRLAMLFGDKRIETYVREAEDTLKQQRNRDPMVNEHEAEWFVLSAANMFVRGELSAATEFIHKAKAHQHYLDDFHLGTLHFLQMHLYSQSGMLAEIVNASEAALYCFTRADFSPGVLAVRRELARCSMWIGRCDEANHKFRELISNVNFNTFIDGDELACTYLFAAENSYWQDHLEQAQAYEREFQELGVKLNNPQFIHMSRYFNLMIGNSVNEINSDSNDFFEHLDEFYTPALADLAVDYMTRSLIASQQLGLAWDIVQRVGIDKQSNFIDARSYRRLKIKLYTCIARGVDLTDITPLISNGLSTATQHGFRFYELQLLALLAWQQLKLGETTSADRILLKAVVLAVETGYVRVILDIPDLVAKLHAFKIDLIALINDSNGAINQTSDLFQLTNQEQCVLEKLAVGNTYPQIASEMVISVNTVRTHVRNLYRKLSVNRREQAVVKAWLFGLLPVDRPCANHSIVPHHRENVPREVGQRDTHQRGPMAPRPEYRP